MITPWAAIERLLRTLADEQRGRTAALEARVASLAQSLAQQPNAKDLRELRQAVRALAPADDRHVLDQIGRLAASGKPIVVGPWTGEIGFELLYWIPFVEWVRRQWSLAPERQLVLSRGGVASWYGSREPSEYADVFAFMTPADFRVAVLDEKRKQRRVGALDEQLVAALAAARGLGEVELLHPRFMYRLFESYWREETGFARLEQFSRYRLFDPPPAAAPAGLPPEYVAVRFYFSECFPDTPANRAFARGAVTALAERLPVVLLNPGFSVDEHEDWAAAAGDRIHTIDAGLSPERNLAVQTAVIAGARAFLGTYGGYAYLAPLCRVPAIACYSRPTFKRHHLHAAQRIVEQTGAASLTVLDVTEAPLVSMAVGGAATEAVGMKP